MLFEVRILSCKEAMKDYEAAEAAIVEAAHHWVEENVAGKTFDNYEAIVAALNEGNKFLEEKQLGPEHRFEVTITPGTRDRIDIIMGEDDEQKEFVTIAEVTEAAPAKD